MRWELKVGHYGWTLRLNPRVGPAFSATQHNLYPFVFHSFSRQNLAPNPVNYNMAMSQTRVSIEWLFNEIKTFFKFVSLKSQVRIGRSSYRRCSVRKGVLRNIAKFTGNHLCQSLFFNKVAGLSPAT